MANFQIKDLAQSDANGNDVFIKSDSNGALSKITFDSIAEGIVGNDAFVDIKKIFSTPNFNFPSNGDIVAEGVELTASASTFTAPKSGNLFILGTLTMSTSANTSKLLISIDGSVVSETTTNQTTPETITIWSLSSVTKGTHTLEVKLKPQNESTVGKVHAYNTCSLNGIMLA